MSKPTIEVSRDGCVWVVRCLLCMGIFALFRETADCKEYLRSVRCCPCCKAETYKVYSMLALLDYTARTLY